METSVQGTKRLRHIAFPGNSLSGRYPMDCGFFTNVTIVAASTLAISIWALRGITHEIWCSAAGIQNETALVNTMVEQSYHAWLLSRFVSCTESVVFLTAS